MAHAVVVAAGEGGTKRRTGIITAMVAAAATTTTMLITINATTVEVVIARTDYCLLLVVHNPGRRREGPLLRGSVYRKQQACEDYPWLKMTTVVYAFYIECTAGFFDWRLYASSGRVFRRRAERHRGPKIPVYRAYRRMRPFETTLPARADRWSMFYVSGTLAFDVLRTLA